MSEATVSRFARHVGCKDYTELKQWVIEHNFFEAPATVIDALAVVVSEQMGAESAKRLSRLHKMEKQYALGR